jgi:hypothetical protein
VYLRLHHQRFYGPRPALRAGLAGLLATGLLALAGCGGGGDDPPERLDEIGHLAARLPTGDALNIAVVDVAAVRRAIGMEPGAAPPTGSKEDDQEFLAETNPAMGIIQSVGFPTVIGDDLTARARLVASVTGDRDATAIATTRPVGTIVPLLREQGLEEEDDSTWVAPDGTYAVALGDHLVGVAESAGDARSIIERTDGEVPDSFEQIDGDGQLVTLARFGASCVDSIGTSDSLHRPGEVSFFTSATPDATRVTTRDEPASEPRVEGDSARVGVQAADDPADEPPALHALEARRVDYDCG